MIGKMKALGLVLAAAFAVSAVAAPAAMAQTNPAHFFSHAGNGKTHLHGEQKGGVFTITLEEGNLTVECPDAGTSFTGTPSTTGEPGEKPETIQKPTFTDVEFHPIYAEEEKTCEVEVGETNFGKAKIDTEGCTYVLSAHTDAEEHAQVHIWCEPEKEITITGALGCTIHVGSQTPEKGVHYTPDETDGNTASEKEAITAEATVTGIHGKATACPGVPETFENAHYESKITVKGYEDKSSEEGPTKGNQVSIRWTKTTE